MKARILASIVSGRTEELQLPSKFKKSHHLNGHLSFLFLPGEVRNIIYDFGIAEHFYAIAWSNDIYSIGSFTYSLHKLGGRSDENLSDLISF